MWYFVCKYFYDDKKQCYNNIPLQAFKSKEEAEEVCDLMQEFYDYNLNVLTDTQLKSQ